MSRVGYNREVHCYTVNFCKSTHELIASDALDNFETFIVDLTLQKRRVTESMVFEAAKVEHYSRHDMDKAISSLLRLRVIKDIVIPSLVSEDIPGKLVVDADTCTMKFVPFNGYYVTQPNKALFSIAVDFNDFDFDGDNEY